MASRSFMIFFIIIQILLSIFKGLSSEPIKKAKQNIQNTLFNRSFWYVKTGKTGSTTLSDIYHKISYEFSISMIFSSDSRYPTVINETDVENHMNSIGKATSYKPVSIVDHIVYSSKIYQMLQSRSPCKVLLFTSVRHPVELFFSNLQFRVDEHFKYTLKAPEQSVNYFNCSDFECFIEKASNLIPQWQFKNLGDNYITRYINSSAITMTKNVQIKSFAENSVKGYDFIFVTERLDESLVIFMILYKLRYEDIFYYTGKSATGFNSNSHKSTKLQRTKELDDKVLRANQYDAAVFKYANVLLDRHIDNLKLHYGDTFINNAINLFHRIRNATEPTSSHIGSSKESLCSFDMHVVAMKSFKYNDAVFQHKWKMCASSILTQFSIETRYVENIIQYS